jgi:hypothetical protein
VGNLSQDQLHRLARLGGMARLEQLRQEEAAIRAAFPDLFGRRGKRPSGPTGTGPAGDGAARRRRAMSVAGRKAVSERMRKYWAERRKAKAAK